MFVNDSAQLAIIVEQVDNEQTAMIRIKEWKDRKFNAFFEPIYENGETRYRVKLWGFSTPDEAKAVVAQIKKFKPSYSIIE